MYGVCIYGTHVFALILNLFGTLLFPYLHSVPVDTIVTLTVGRHCFVLPREKSFHDLWMCGLSDPQHLLAVQYY